MKRFMIFAGTAEGRELSEYLKTRDVGLSVYTATEYGASLIGEDDRTQVHDGRLDESEMEQAIRQFFPDCVLDATHPYALEVSTNIRSACAACDVHYERVVRASEDTGDSADGRVRCFETIAEAVRWLDTTSGNILVTTGSKELDIYTGVHQYQSRVYARVLSLPEVVQHCSELGLTGAHLICMQGPFSESMNRAMIEQYQIKYLVTKEAGHAGGFYEKVKAAEKTGVTLIVIGRPVKETGMSLADCIDFLKRETAPRRGTQNMAERRRVIVAGLGMGSAETMTQEVVDACLSCDLVIGAKRMTEAVIRVRGCDVASYEGYKPEEICCYIEEHTEYQKILVALSGDPGFYSGAKRLLPKLTLPYTVLPGLSSLSYFCAKIARPWSDVRCVSMHGRVGNMITVLRTYGKVFTLAGSGDSLSRICQDLQHFGMTDVQIWVGERLGYPEESVFSGTPASFVKRQTDTLCVMYLEWEPAVRYVTGRIPDERFIRDTVPMTKEEVRTVSLSKLQLTPDSVLYDVGAGTGSVSVEAASLLTEGRVYAIEKKEQAVSLIARNREVFASENLYIIEGEAPGALRELPVPTHAFIGGSSGSLSEIIDSLLDKNPRIRIVVNAITLETISEMMDVIRTRPFAETEVVQLSVSYAREIGSYHLMTGQNPVYIISCTGARP